MPATHTTGRAVAALATMFALFLPAPAAHAGTSDLPDGLDIDVSAVNGSGCPGNATVERSEDHARLVVTSPTFLAQVGTGTKLTDYRKNCSMLLKVTVPDGMTWALKAATRRGFASLTDGVRALGRSSYSFVGQSAPAQIEHWYTGPWNDNWAARDDIDIAALRWAPCDDPGRGLAVNTEVRLPFGYSGSVSLMTLDETAIDARTDLAFKRCPGQQ